MFKRKSFQKKGALLLVLAVFSFIFIGIGVQAVESKCGESWSNTSVSEPYRCYEFQVYRCVNNSCGRNGGTMEQGTKWYMCVDTTHSWGNDCRSYSRTSTSKSGPYGPDQIEPYGEVGDYQICPTQYNSWSETVPVPECKGSCYPAPNQKLLSDPELSPKNVADGTKYKLPINFGWEDNVETAVAEEPNNCTVDSYDFNIVNPSISKIVTGRQLQSQKDAPYKLSCQLQSNKAYQWKVRACFGGDCGDWSGNQNFTTSPVPEPVSPYDSDWQDINKRTVDIPTKLDWCDVSTTKSYYVRLYRDGEFYFPLPVEKLVNDPVVSEITLDTSIITKYKDYEWEIANCSNATNSKCGISCNDNQDGDTCGDYSQKWQFETGDLTLPAPEIISPISGTAVNRETELKWEPAGFLGVEAYYYEIRKEGEIVAKTDTPIGITSVLFADLWNKLRYNTTYTTEVQSCWEENIEKCESPTVITFETTGGGPDLTSPTQNEQNVIVPVDLTWAEVPGALSYKYQISVNPSFGNIIKTNITAETETSVDYPILNQNTTYYWRVSSCADREANFCGSSENIWSQIGAFKTAALTAPLNPIPNNGADFLTSENYLKWDKVLGAKFYEYKIGSEIDGLTQTNYGFIQTGILALGNYIWQVRACLDENCQDAGPWATYNFNLTQSEECKDSSVSLVPCGRNCDSSATPWNERKPCQFQDIFYIFKNILDFILWTMVPLVLVLLAMASGIIYYLALGDTNKISLVKKIWKSAGIGCLIIFGAWSAITLLLLFLGFQINLFGRWWQFPT